MQARDEDRTVITGDAKAKRTSSQMVTIIKDPLFWYVITRFVASKSSHVISGVDFFAFSRFRSMKRHLEPLAIATNVTQASFCRLDQVLLTLGHLIMQYKSMTDPDDVVGCTAIIESIEARWATADQEILIAAVILNPFYKSTPFAALRFLTNAGIHSLLTRLWERFYRTAPPLEFHEQMIGYLNGTALFADLGSACNIVQVVAQREVWHPVMSIGLH
jgi:hypothetical protein